MWIGNFYQPEKTLPVFYPINTSILMSTRSIYPRELKTKDITESESLDLDIFLEKDINNNLATKLYDKRDESNFSMTNFH